MNTPDNKMTFEYVDRHRKVKDTVYQEMKEHFTDTVFELSKQRNPDCILIAEGKSLKAHKFLLAAASPLLKDAFSIEQNIGSTMVVVPEVEFDDLLAVKELMYEGKVELSCEQMVGLNKVAKALQVEMFTDNIPMNAANNSDTQNVSQKMAKNSTSLNSLCPSSIIPKPSSVSSGKSLFTSCDDLSASENDSMGKFGGIPFTSTPGENSPYAQIIDVGTEGN